MQGDSSWQKVTSHRSEGGPGGTQLRNCSPVETSWQKAISSDIGVRRYSTLRQEATSSDCDDTCCQKDLPELPPSLGLTRGKEQPVLHNGPGPRTRSPLHADVEAGDVLLHPTEVTVGEPTEVSIMWPALHYRRRCHLGQ